MAKSAEQLTRASRQRQSNVADDRASVGAGDYAHIIFSVGDQKRTVVDYKLAKAVGKGRNFEQGKAMFASLAGPLRLRLTGTRTFSSGSVLLEYVSDS